MLGCYDFCGHYEWTFAWLEQQGGEALVLRYWQKCIAEDSQRHARELIVGGGVDGMKKYWGHTLNEEAADFALTTDGKRFRGDMYSCPSKGFLLANKLEQYADYCDHCLGWLGPIMAEAGFVVDHEHNHCGQCWWEFRRPEDAPSVKPGDFAGTKDVRLRQEWERGKKDVFAGVTRVRPKFEPEVED